MSGLAIRLARLSGAGVRLPEWLLRTAVRRGAKHYQRDFDPSLPPDNPAISDEAIGVALCLGQMPNDPWFIRAAAQLLSSPRVDPQRLARLAEMERVEPVLLHIAAACARVDEASEPWATLRRQLIRGAPSAPKPFRTGRGLPFYRASRATATRHHSGSSVVNNPLGLCPSNSHGGQPRRFINTPIHGGVGAARREGKPF